MSNAVSVLNGASFTGLAEVKDAGLVGMITLRGDLASKSLAKAVKECTGCAIPGIRKVTQADGTTVVWMSPDELLIVTAYQDVDAKVDALSTALTGAHALVVNVSDARAMFTVSGSGAREVLAKVAPVDFAADQFVPGGFRRTRLAQVAGAFWLDTDACFNIVCFRSVGQYVFDLLTTSADANAEVGVY
ncbi:sarcosine oxidase subunit gamma [Epibacterium ulvae]|uniref:sarcosine oxidase subunit gamma n=1 Tax=Epibacterium ulvae TaxID=1156985 RepID=UPI001BFC9993|nr:sarcosine oxidase subunit gamma family protein [Epibacterium ulvae]MBT8155431.1 sarcosine oxidase subunit gamma [Epibacterium ulvae]